MTEKDDTEARREAELMTEAVKLIVRNIRDTSEHKRDVIYGASSILAVIAGALLDRLGFPHEEHADVQIKTDLEEDASVIITWVKEEDASVE